MHFSEKNGSKKYIMADFILGFSMIKRNYWNIIVFTVII